MQHDHIDKNINLAYLKHSLIDKLKFQTLKPGLKYRKRNYSTNFHPLSDLVYS